MKTSFVISAMAAAAAALPTNSKQCPNVPQNANFDDLKGVPALPFNTIPTPYKGLFFQGIEFSVVVPITLAPGIVPHSGNNYAGIGAVSELQGTPMLTTNYPESEIESFQLESFYFGCLIQLANGVTAVPSACTINFTGYKGDDNTVSSSQQVCSQSYSYNPTTALGSQQQAFGSFDDCKGKDLQFATIQFNLPGGLAVAEPLAGLVLDDVKFSTKAKTCSK